MLEQLHQFWGWSAVVWGFAARNIKLRENMKCTKNNIQYCYSDANDTKCDEIQHIHSFI